MIFPKAELSGVTNKQDQKCAFSEKTKQERRMILRYKQDGVLRAMSETNCKLNPLAI
jgi:hypothetical protein